MRRNSETAGISGPLSWREDLRAIGALLDANQGPDVLQAGSVTPDPNRDPVGGSGKNTEFGNAAEQPGQGSHRPAAGPREGSAHAAPIPADEAHEVLGQAGLAHEAREDVVEARVWRPQMRFHLAPPILWIYYWFHPLEHSPHRAFHLIGYPLGGAKLKHPQGWAWWELGIRIGPRHLHWGDAGICAFEDPAEWSPSDSLIELLDLYSVWTARHLYLQTFGRWPGAQHLHTPYERLTEHQPGELCGCGSTEREYEECHLDEDLATPTEEIIRGIRERRVPGRRLTPVPSRLRPTHDGVFTPTTKLIPPHILRVRNEIWGIADTAPQQLRVLNFVVNSDPKGRWQRAAGYNSTLGSSR